MIDVNVQFARDGFALDAAFESHADVLGVFGPSGAGKTTLLHIIAGLVRPQAGHIRINDRTLFDDASQIHVPVHQRRIGVVFQEHRLFPHRSVAGNLRYGARRGAEARFDEAVELLELGPLLDRRVPDLSGGERQRVALGRALLSSPSLLLLDEPLASLDVRLRRQILPYLARVSDAFAVPMMWVSHDLSDLLQLTDHLLLLDRGRTVACGAYGELIHDARAFAVVHDRGMTNVIRTRVTGHDAIDGVSMLAIQSSAAADTHASTELVVPLLSLAVGEEVIAAVQPWDVALAEREVSGVSIRNQLAGRVVRVTSHDARVLVEVDIGTPLVVEVSRRSVARMAIEPGKPVVCLIKSHAIRCADDVAIRID